MKNKLEDAKKTLQHHMVESMRKIYDAQSEKSRIKNNEEHDVIPNLEMANTAMSTLSQIQNLISSVLSQGS